MIRARWPSPLCRTGRRAGIDRDAEEHQGERRHHARLPRIVDPIFLSRRRPEAGRRPMDICYKIVDAVKKELKLDKLEVKLNPVSWLARISLMANGTIDLECGSTTNNTDRLKQVAITNTHFLLDRHPVRFQESRASSARLMISRASRWPPPRAPPTSSSSPRP